MLKIKIEYSGALRMMAITLFALTVFVGCGSGLDPAWQSDTSILFQFKEPGSETPSANTGRAIIQGGGFLYIRTGSSAASAKLYGPYAVKSGSPLEVKDIDAGTLDYLMVLYSARQLPVSVISDGLLLRDEAAMIDVFEESSVFNGELLGEFSLNFRNNVKITAGVRNTIAMTLIPWASSSDMSWDGDYGYGSLYNAGPDKQRKFIMLPQNSYFLEYVTPVPALFTMRFVSYDAPAGSLPAGPFALYDHDGKLIDYSGTSYSLGGDMIEELVFEVPTFTGDSQYYLYYEMGPGTMEFAIEVLADGGLIEPTTLYVSATGTSSSAGTELDPTTLENALSNSVVDHVILVDSIAVANPLTVNKTMYIQGLTGTEVLSRQSGNTAEIFIAGSSSDLTLSNLTIQGTDYPDNKSLIFIQPSGYVYLESTVLLTGNKASAIKGGAVYVAGGTFYMQDATISDTLALDGGAIYAESGSRVEIQGLDAKILNTTATRYGGAIYMQSNVVHTEQSNAVYEGNNSGVAFPVNATEQAVTDLATLVDALASYTHLGPIVPANTITLPAQVNFSMGQSAFISGRTGYTFNRDSGYQQALFAVSGNSSLTFDSVIIDGNNTVAASESMIVIGAYGTVSLRGTAVLRNNNGGSGVSGGAVQIQTGGALNLYDSSSITQNTAGSGGGVFAATGSTLNVAIGIWEDYIFGNNASVASPDLLQQ